MTKQLVLASMVSVAALCACDDLTVPTKIVVGGDTDGGGDAGMMMVHGQGIAPPGALLGELKENFMGLGGNIQTWAIAGPDGKITEWSFTLPIATVTGIPDTTTVDLIFFLELPDIVKTQTIFKSLDYSFLPHGHVPAGVYDVPHWEWHVSTFTEAERAAIDCTDPAQPTTDNIPPNWILFPECLAKTGYHAYDLAAPEFNREKFTKGDYLSYYRAARLGGMEPQATRTLWQARADIDFGATPKMAKYGVTGLYPGKLYASYNGSNETYTLTYSDFAPVQ